MVYKSKKAAKADDLSPEHLAKLRWLTPRQTAVYLQVSRNTLQEMQETLPHSRLSARVIRFDREQLDKCVAEKSAAV